MQSSSTFGVVFFNEFEDPFVVMPSLEAPHVQGSDEIILHNESAVHYDVTSADSDVSSLDLDGDFSDDDAEKCHDVTSDIITDTLRIVRPDVDAVMPSPARVLTPGANERATPLPAAVSFRHNPYALRVIKCRMEPTSSDFVKGAQKSTVPLCPCVALARESAQIPAPAVAQATNPESSDEQQHASVKPKSMCCYFKQKGFCKMGDKCWHGHEGDLYTPCHFGAACKAGHATLVAIMQQKQPSSVPTAPAVRSMQDSAASLIAMQTRVTVRVGAAHPQQYAPLQLNRLSSSPN